MYGEHAYEHALRGETIERINYILCDNEIDFQEKVYAILDLMYQNGYMGEEE